MLQVWWLDKHLNYCTVLYVPARRAWRSLRPCRISSSSFLVRSSSSRSRLSPSSLMRNKKSLTSSELLFSAIAVCLGEGIGGTRDDAIYRGLHTLPAIHKAADTRMGQRKMSEDRNNTPLNGRCGSEGGESAVVQKFKFRCLRGDLSVFLVSRSDAPTESDSGTRRAPPHRKLMCRYLTIPVVTM